MTKTKEIAWTFANGTEIVVAVTGTSETVGITHNADGLKFPGTKVVRELTITATANGAEVGRCKEYPNSVAPNNAQGLVAHIGKLGLDAERMEEIKAAITEVRTTIDPPATNADYQDGYDAIAQAMAE